MCGATPHSADIGLMCPGRYELCNCSVVYNIQNATLQVWFSLVWVIPFHVDKYSVVIRIYDLGE